MSLAIDKQLSAQNLSILITRIVDARPAKVFDAWLSRDDVSRWWGPRDGRRDWSTPQVEINPKPGGSYRISCQSPNGKVVSMRGVYQDIEKPHRLVMTHAWEMNGNVMPERLITVDFAETDGKTRVSFRIDGFAECSSDGEIEGWNQCIDRLVQYFADRLHAVQAEEELRESMAAWSKALEEKDVNGLVAECAPDVLLFDVKPPFQLKGVEAYRTNWEKCLPHFPAKFKSERRDVTITTEGDLAFMHCLHHIQPLSGNHPSGSTWMRVTVCFRRINGQWKAVHEHVSVPFDPMTGKATFITDPQNIA